MPGVKNKYLIIAANLLTVFVALKMVYDIISLKTAPLDHLCLPLLLIISVFLTLYYTSGSDPGPDREKETEAAADIGAGESCAANLGQLLTNICHEIKTPMTGILGSVDLLEQSPLDNDQLEHLDNIKTCADDMLAVFNEILNASKIEQGQVGLNLAPCRIRPFLTEILQNTQPLLQVKGLKLQLQIDEGLPDSIVLDKAKLQQVVGSLLGNALKFTRQGSVLIEAVSCCSRDSEYLLLKIEDTGIGISPQELQNIFTPFKQVDGSNTREYGGIGLGLYICRRLVELMDGSIWAESQLGTGTAIYIEIPLLKEYPGISCDPAETASGTPDHAFLGFQPAKVLLTEDNPLNQKIVFQMLEKNGFSCQVVNNGLECLTALHREPFDVVLLDMQMPVMDGYETAGAIRRDQSLKDIAVIAMTAHSMVGDKEKCIASGCTDYIAKPFKAQELAEIITRHLPVNRRDTLPQIDSQLINELMPDLLEMLSEMIDSLHLAWRRKDLEHIQSVGHDIKGTAGMYGLSSISATANRLERAAQEYDYRNTAYLMQVLQDQYHQSQADYMNKDIASL